MPTRIRGALHRLTALYPSCTAGLGRLLSTENMSVLKKKPVNMFDSSRGKGHRCSSNVSISFFNRIKKTSLLFPADILREKTIHESKAKVETPHWNLTLSYNDAKNREDSLKVSCNNLKGFMEER